MPCRVCLDDKGLVDCRKAPALASIRGVSFGSDDDTILPSEQVAWTLQRCFNRGGNDIAPFGGMYITHRTRSHYSIEMASASSQFHTSSGGGSSQFPWIKEGRGLGGDKLECELMFDLDANLEANNVAGLGPSVPRCNNRRSRFPPRQARSEAYAGEIDDSIEDTHL